MPDHEVLVELGELWHIALINAKHEARQNHPEWQDNAIRSFVCAPRVDERQNYLNELKIPRFHNEGLRFIEPLSRKQAITEGQAQITPEKPDFSGSGAHGHTILYPIERIGWASKNQSAHDGMHGQGANPETTGTVDGRH